MQIGRICIGSFRMFSFFCFFCWWCIDIFIYIYTYINWTLPLSFLSLFQVTISVKEHPSQDDNGDDDTWTHKRATNWIEHDECDQPLTFMPFLFVVVVVFKVFVTSIVCPIDASETKIDSFVCWMFQLVTEADRIWSSCTQSTYIVYIYIYIYIYWAYDHRQWW